MDKVAPHSPCLELTSGPAILTELERGGLINVLERVEQNPAEAQYAALSPDLYPAANDWLKRMVPDGRLYRHQALSLAAIARGENVVLSTGTASGKSLVFQMPIIAKPLASAATSIVCYPQKALGSDQAARWRAALEAAGLSPELVVEINGDVPPSEREALLQKARIAVITPDIGHAWMMSRLASPIVQNFLGRLETVVIDEAHALEGAFGSSAAYLFRRMNEAAGALRRTGVPGLQYIAATATVHDAPRHLASLTGAEFTEICEAENGAPRAGRTIVHIDGPAGGAAGEAALAALLQQIIPLVGDQAFLALADSRQGVERMTRGVGHPRVLPYRSGYEAIDRRRIEKALRRGELIGVVSTSALELGIDIPQFIVGLNLGLPQTRKSLMQRIGRIGRRSAGCFIIMAPRTTFTQIGTTLGEFLKRPAEPSPLYLENRYIQYAQARCYLEECAALPRTPLTSKDATWPESFGAMVAVAAGNAPRPRELDQLAIAGGNAPHINYPLRQIGDDRFALKLAGAMGEKIGTIALQQAIREAYPGAIYYHCQAALRVIEWRVNSYERSIILRRVADAEPTKPLLRNWVNGSYSSAEVIGGRIRRSALGTIAEAQLQVVEAVEGYRHGNVAALYSNLRQADQRLRRQQREFQSTGVILQISQSWFAGSAKAQANARRDLGRALKNLLCREYGVASTEIEVASSNVALHNPGGVIRLDDAIAIYDNLQGGLRLTANLYDHVDALAKRLCRGAEAAGDDALLDIEMAGSFSKWTASLRDANAEIYEHITLAEEEVIVFAPGSKVSVATNGRVFERELLEPNLMEMPDGEKLMYRFRCESGTSGWTAHDAIRPLGQAWSRVIWNRATNDFRPMVQGAQLPTQIAESAIS